MPASISITGLSSITADGTPLFSDLDLVFGRERTGLVGRNGSGKSTLLRLISGQLRPCSGRIQVIGSVAMMQQDAMARPDDTIADLFNVRSDLALLVRAEAGQATEDDLAAADWTLSARIEAALGRCGLSVDLQTPLASLSGGQRSRAALAAMLLAAPDFMLLDEPTNNLDREGRSIVLDLLSGWTGGAIIASHDRELLEGMDAIVELTRLGAASYGGGYSAYRQRKDTELEAVLRDLAHAEKTVSEVAQRAQMAAERKARKDGAGHRARSRGDQPKSMLDFAKGRAETSGGSGTRLREARREEAAGELTAAREKVEVLQPLRMDLAPTDLPSGKTILRLENVTGGHDPERPVIRNFSLTVVGPERIVLSGPNGSGKTTLLDMVSGRLTPEAGEVQLSTTFSLLDQHVGVLDPAQTLRENYLTLNPAANTHDAHTALARFGFRAGDALRTVGGLSGGERLRGGLACILGGTPPPMLLILDEPTNHLDLDGIAALEAALAAYDGAVLAVSHDRAFLSSLAPDREIRLPV
ncbi:ABC-F family ATP-binding cassette domain-containing protein [Halovulum sp. GXIMD14794]